MKIATLNIDWAKKYNSKYHYVTIENYLNKQDFDFLILTEAVDLNLNNYEFKYFSNSIPENQIHENLDYLIFLAGEKGFRTIIYSKIPFKRKFKVNDDKISLALEFATEFGDLVLYATIIGTQFRRKPFAEVELKNCIRDCESISKTNPKLIVVGDLNTSFFEHEKDYTINKHTTIALKNLFDKLNLTNLTETLEQNIDHIVVSNFIKKKFVRCEEFVEKGKLSDHAGILLTLQI